MIGSKMFHICHKVFPLSVSKVAIISKSGQRSDQSHGCCSRQPRRSTDLVDLCASLYRRACRRQLETLPRAGV